MALGTTYLSQAVPNPFFGVLPTNTTQGATATTQRRNLLMPYPQFTTITEGAQSLGRSWYNSFQFKAEKRMSHGLSVLLSYTLSKTMEQLAFLNPQDKQLSREIGTYDVPQRLVISGIYEFPVGPHRKWLNHGIASHVIGGWSVNWNMIAQSGIPISFPSGYYIYGDPEALQRAEPEPLVQHVFEHLGAAAAGHAAHVEAPQPHASASIRGRSTT